jgi:hypothetical protein
VADTTVWAVLAQPALLHEGGALRNAAAWATLTTGVGNLAKILFRLVLTISLSAITMVGYAADREVAIRERLPPPPRCGCCGCLHTFYDYHRELRSTYGVHMDPRNYDQTEPHYHFGRMRAYPHYYSDWGFELHY